MGGNVLDDVFAVLSVATKLEENEDSRIEAATKYYEGVYLMRQYLQRLPATADQQQKRDLLEKKAKHYENLAQKCLASSTNSTISRGGFGSDGISTLSPCSDSQRTIATDPRSPIAKTSFFNADSSVIPMPVPLPPSAGTPSQPVPKNNSAAYHTPQSPRFSLSTFVNQTTSQANAKLAHAMDVDESSGGGNNRQRQQAAIKIYMEAAELYLKAIKACQENRQNPNRRSDQNVLNVLTRRMEQTLDRVEQLKNPNKKLHHEQKQRQQKPISSTASTTTTTATNKKSAQPSLTQDEISVLTRSSLISSGLFLPWSEEEARKMNLTTAPPPLLNSKTNTANVMKLFRDEEGDLCLSEKQKKRFYKWARPSEILAIRQQYRGGGAVGKPVMVLGKVSPYTIRQQGVTDCSFIASLCICAAYERRFKKSLISPIVYPQSSSSSSSSDSDSGRMVYNPEGKYMVKLWLNGVARRVIVDDRLPIDKQGNLLCAHTQCPPGQLELYVPIIEKAFLKMAGGGYSFPGSNSGVDLYSITGWIPERILFPKDPHKVRDHETPRERAWERLMSAHSFGDCLITMSSEANITNEQAEKIGLVTGHAYAVLAVMQTRDGTRLLQLKNPWAHRGWKGRFSCYDANSWRDPNFCAEVGYNPELAKKRDDGVFWICWEDVLLYYQNIHLSWNPALFAHQQTTHNFWPKDQGPRDDTFNCGENPQYVLTMSPQALDKGASLWIQISRHVTKQEQEGSEVTDYLTIHLHRNNKTKERIWYPRSKQNVLTGAYTNNPHCLVRYDITDKSDAYLSIVLSQFEKSHDLGYTLSCYCTEPFSLGPPSKDLPFSRTLTSSWTPATAGGPVGTKRFYSNPQFAVEVPSGDAYFQITCSAPKSLALNVMLVPTDSYGQRATRIRDEPPVDSGNYRHGFVVTKRQFAEGGTYALIVSNYSPGETATFRVRITSTKKIPRIDEILE